MIKITHGIAVLREVEDGYELVHFCGYEQEPTQQDLDILREELATDEDFGLAQVSDLRFVRASDELVAEYRELLADADGIIYEEHELN